MKRPNSDTLNSHHKNKLKKQQHFLSQMKNENQQVLILFCSQTGTAEELAGRLAKDFVRYGKMALVMDSEEVDPDDIAEYNEIDNLLVVIFVSTYNGGDPDNARKFFGSLRKHKYKLKGIRFAVFGLGNKIYKNHYNAVGTFLDQRLEELGAERVFEIGLGDDSADLEDDFMRWREAFLPAVAKLYELEISNDGGLEHQYCLEIIEEPTANIFTGEYGTTGAYERQRPLIDQNNPYFSKIVSRQNKCTMSNDKIDEYTVFDIEDSGIRYEAGDHLAVFPTNDFELVEKLGKVLDANLGTVIKLINTDEESSKRHLFPCPCTFKTALTHYVDICAPVKSHVLKALAEYTSDEVQKQWLYILSSPSKGGFSEYTTCIGNEIGNILDVLRTFDTCKPPIEDLLELLPRLQARYYSISSWQDEDPNVVSVKILRDTNGDRLIKGVCTHYLSQLKPNDTTPIFVRKLTMQLPLHLKPPVIIIGSDLAPFHGFLQKRSWQKSQGKEIGPIVLFYGCRHPERDYIYQEEILKYKDEGVITDLCFAFSRFQDTKIYVQHLIWKKRVCLWELIQEKAMIYVCGDARNMARDVQNTFLKVFQQIGGMEVEASQKFFKDLERQRRYQADVWS